MMSPLERLVEVPKLSHKTSALDTLPTEVEELPFTFLNLYVPTEETI